MQLKTDEMFDMLNFLCDPDQSQSDFPPCLDELKGLLSNSTFSNLKDSLAAKMKKQIEDRLLLPGISTKLIIGFYIQVIRVFKFIDPSTLLLEVVSGPIREYLRTRKDTLRNIVKIILSGENSEL